MNIRRLLVDVDKALARPDLLDLAEALDGVGGVDGINITVTEIDVETVGPEVTVEGYGIDVDAVSTAVEKCGAARHNVDEIVVGARIVERVPRAR